MAVVCIVCDEPFVPRARIDANVRFCSKRCRDNERSRRMPKPPRLTVHCAVCDVAFDKHYRKRYCSALCRREGEIECLSRRREELRAYRRYYYLHRRNPAKKYGHYPCQQREIAARKARAEARKQKRDRRADIVIAAREMQALRWAVYGDGLSRLRPGIQPEFTAEEAKERKRQANRKKQRAEHAALKIYREMGFVASRRDRRSIYRALKAELPTI